MRQVPTLLSAGVCVAMTVAVAGCDGLPRSNPSPVAPTITVPAAAPPAVSVSVSGVVTENDRPLGYVGVEVFWSWGPGSGMSISGTTDMAGRYWIGGMPVGQMVWAVAHKDGYVQPCAASATIQTAATLNLELTPLANVSAARGASDPNTRTVSGRVYETTSSGRQPVAGVSLGWMPVYYESVASTMTDATGHYLLCGLPQGPISDVGVFKEGFRHVWASFEPGRDATVDIEISRR
jgi:hypothetical protein